MTDDLSTKLAANLKRMRDERGVSQAQLAIQSSVPRPTIAHMESGQANPTLSVVMKVARSLGVSIDRLADASSVPIRILTSRNLPQKRTSKVTRLQVVAPGTMRDAGLEKITVKEAGKLKVRPQASQPELFLCEAGEFEVVCGQHRLKLSEHQLAWITEEAELLSSSGGLLFRVFSK